MKFACVLLIFVLSTTFAFPSGLPEGKGRKNKILIADSLNKLAENSMDNNLEFQKIYASEALALSGQIKYIKGQNDALTTLSKYYLASEDYVKTLDLYFKIIDLYDHKNDDENLILAYSRVTQFFLVTTKDYDLAKKYIDMMDRVAQKSAAPITKGLVFLHRAKYFYAKGDYNLAIRFLYLSIPYFQSGHDNLREGDVFKVLGDAFLQKKMYVQSEYNYRQAASFYAKIPNPTELAVLYTRLAHIFNVLDDNKLNLYFNLSALRIREKIGPSKLISSSLLNVGEAYWLLGRKDSASYYLRRSLQLAERIKCTEQLETIYSQLSDFAISENRFADALKYFQARVVYRTKLNRERTQSSILTLEANRTIRANEVQNELLNQEILITDLRIRNLRIQILFFEVAFLILLFIIFFVDTLARKNRKRKNELAELNKRLTQEINIRIEAEGRLNRSQELHQFLAENTVDVISLMDASMHRLYVSPSCVKLYGYSAGEILRMNSMLDLVEPSYQVSVNQHLLEMLRAKKSTRYIYKVLRKDGSTFWAEANINTIINPETHEVTNLITVVRDISERTKHEEELSENSRQKEYLLREIHNRVKNNFAILVSLMNMQRNQSDNPELSSSLKDLQLRVRTMSLVHEQLYQSQEISTIPFDNYLYHLAQIISSSFNNNRIHLQTDIHPCTVAIEMALPMGLIINELITNAYKYAFPGNRTGTIQIRLFPENDDKFSITICDNGIGLPADFTMENTQSMGSQIVGILVEQIEAILEVSSDGGACFRILFSTAQEK